MASIGSVAYGRRAVLPWAVLAAALGCAESKPPSAPARDTPAHGDCEPDREPRCRDGVAETCEEDPAGRPRLRARDCRAEALHCVDGIGCTACEPGARECLGPDVIECDEDGVTFRVVESCDGSGEGCAAGSCANLCTRAAELGSHFGCDFVLTNLDNIAYDGRSGRSGSSFAIALTNPNPVPAAVEVHAIDSEAAPPLHARCMRARRSTASP